MITQLDNINIGDGKLYDVQVNESGQVVATRCHGYWAMTNGNIGSEWLKEQLQIAALRSFTSRAKAQPTKFIVQDRELKTGHINREGKLVDVRPVEIELSYPRPNKASVNAKVRIKPQVDVSDANSGIEKIWGNRLFECELTSLNIQNGHLVSATNGYFDVEFNPSVFLQEPPERTKQEQEKRYTWEDYRNSENECYKKVQEKLNEVTNEFVTKYPKDSRKFGSKATQNISIESLLTEHVPELKRLKEISQPHQFNKNITLYIGWLRDAVNVYWFNKAKEKKDGRQTNA